MQEIPLSILTWPMKWETPFLPEADAEDAETVIARVLFFPPTRSGDWRSIARAAPRNRYPAFFLLLVHVDDPVLLRGCERR